MNVHADDVMMFRQRPHPTNPDKMFYDVWLFELVPDGEEWPERPKHKRSEEHTSELQSLMRISYAVFCLKKKNKKMNKWRLNYTNDIREHSQNDETEDT